MQAKIRNLLSWASNMAMYPFGRPKKVEDGDLHYISGTRRCIGALVDLLLVGLVLQLLYGCFIYAFPKNEETFKAVEKYKMGGTLKEEEAVLKNKYLSKVLLFQAFQLLIVYVYYTYMWIKFSTTVGMFLMGLQVIDEGSLKPMRLKQATLRFVYAILSGIPLGLGIIWSNFDSRKRGWHDMLAKTVVVTKKSLKRHKELSQTV